MPRLKRRTENKLTVYRRHAKGCPITDIKDMDNCQCPFYVHGRLGSKRVRIPLNTRKRSVAERLKEEMLESGTPKPPDPGPGKIHAVGTPDPGTMTIEEAQQRFGKLTGRGLTPGSIAAYTRTGTDFREWGEKQKPAITRMAQISTGVIAAYLDARSDGRQWKPRTRQSRLGDLRVFFNLAEDMKWIATSPTRNRTTNRVLKGETPSEHAREPLSIGQVAALLEAVETIRLGLATGNTPKALELEKLQRPRLRALVYLLLASGVRISDAAFMECASLGKNGILDFRIIKTGKRVGLPIGIDKRAADALRALPKHRIYFFMPDRDDDYRESRKALYEGRKKAFWEAMPEPAKKDAFNCLQIVIRAMRHAGIETGGCHRLRDTFAVNYLANGGDVFKLQQMLGHKNVKTTIDHYVNLVPGYREKMAQNIALNYEFPAAG